MATTHAVSTASNTVTTASSENSSTLEHRVDSVGRSRLQGIKNFFSALLYVVTRPFVWTVQIITTPFIWAYERLSSKSHDETTDEAVEMKEMTSGPVEETQTPTVDTAPVQEEAAPTQHTVSTETQAEDEPEEVKAPPQEPSSTKSMLKSAAIAVGVTALVLGGAYLFPNAAANTLMYPLDLYNSMPNVSQYIPSVSMPNISMPNLSNLPGASTVSNIASSGISIASDVGSMLKDGICGLASAPGYLLNSAWESVQDFGGFISNLFASTPNASFVNGSGFNGSGFNGSGFNGSGFNGSGFNGSGFNGSGFNGSGTVLNGSGTVLNGYRLSGQCPARVITASSPGSTSILSRLSSVFNGSSTQCPARAITASSPGSTSILSRLSSVFNGSSGQCPITGK
jgi:hypothetical protein